MKKLISIISALLLLFTVAGCDDAEDTRIYLELPQIPSTLDPQTAKTDAELLIVRNLFEGLVRQDKNGEIKNGVAEKYEKNGNTYTFYLNKKASWDTGEKLYAEDFVFGIRRAVDPKTACPFADKLMCIEGANAVRNGANPETLAVKAEDKHTLSITLSYDDPEFLKTLTTAPCMPCDEEFFNSTVGRYGLDKKSVISNGSYYLSKWNQTDFGIRIYKNAQYFGSFTAKNGGVFLSKSSEFTAYEELSSETVDIAFIESKDVDKATSAGFKVQRNQNICWVLTLNPEMSADMRRSFSSLIDRNSLLSKYGNQLSPAESLYPEVIDAAAVGNVREYAPENAKNLFLQAVRKLDGKTFPKTTLYYYDDPVIKPIINDMIGHWQQNLSAFINMSASDNLKVLQNELHSPSVQMAVFPVTATVSAEKEYLSVFGVSDSRELARKTENDLIIPLFFDTANLGISNEISGIVFEKENGYIDLSEAVKG